MGQDIQTDITISERINGKKANLQIYGPHSVNEDGTIMPFEEQLAIVSHYIQNRDYIKLPYEEKALGLIQDIFGISNDKVSERTVSRLSRRCQLSRQRRNLSKTVRNRRARRQQKNLQVWSSFVSILR